MLTLDCEINEIKEIGDEKYLVNMTCGRYRLLLEIYRRVFDFTVISRTRITIDRNELICRDSHLCITVISEVKSRQPGKNEEIVVFTSNGLKIILRSMAPEKLYSEIAIDRKYYIGLVQI